MNWPEYKSFCVARSACMQIMTETDDLYDLKSWDGPRSEGCQLIKKNSSIVVADRQAMDGYVDDFEQNFKAKCDGILQEKVGGRPVYRSESRPLEFTSWFSISGDDIENQIIGGGTVAKWDFTNSLDDQTFDLKFLDPICIKDGFVAWTGGSPNCFVSAEIICPVGGYYLANEGTNAGTYVQATVETTINKYINRIPCMGDAPMGVDYEVEAASEVIPAGYIVRITAESDVNTFKGFIRGEFYRARSVILE